MAARCALSSFEMRAEKAAKPSPSASRTLSITWLIEATAAPSLSLSSLMVMMEVCGGWSGARPKAAVRSLSRSRHS